MNRIILKIFLWGAVVIWMAVIFMFSAETATESTETSDGIVDILADRLLSDQKDSMTESEFAAASEKISLFVRKTAHFSSYMLLGILVTAALFQHDLKKSVRKVSAFAICVLYAVSDEFHQTFVPGRAGRVLDVLIDSAGALCGISAVIIIAALIKKYKTKNNIHT